MSQNELCLLDCTLRDGGYVNEWKWGGLCAKAIIKCLERANIDYIEVGFLRDVDSCDKGVTVCNTIEELNEFIPNDVSNSCYAAMIMNGAYNIENLSPYSGDGIHMIRVTAHEYDIEEGLMLAAKIKSLGYLVSFNPINIMGYNDEKILWIIDRINEMQPYQFSIVDTFGSMKRKDLNRIIYIADNNLSKDIRLGLHLHENMSLSYSLAQQFIDMHLNRPITIDGSLYGMGRMPGNLPIELIADYTNEYTEKKYDIDYLLDAIQDYIEPLKGVTKWGYSPAFFLSAKNNIHRNYAEFYINKGDLSSKDISHILASFDKESISTFDEKYAEKKYIDYKSNIVDDSFAMKQLRVLLSNKSILILAPGESLMTEQDRIRKYIRNTSPIIIAVNFVPEEYNCDYAFFSNGKRYSQFSYSDCNLIITSNIETDKAAYMVSYNRLSGAFSQGYNSMIMLLKLIKELGIEECTVAGADGYIDGRKHYYESSLELGLKKNLNYNFEVKEAIRMLRINVNFLTSSAYE